MASVKSLKKEDLYCSCPYTDLPFATTDELETLSTFIGQARAIEALQFGMEMQSEGYNLFALGPAGVGKQSLVEHFIEQEMIGEGTPDDWCYVNNFVQPQKPVALRLPPGKGSELYKDMKRLSEDLLNALTTSFESEEYQMRRQMLEDELKEQPEKYFDALQEKAKELSFVLLKMPTGLVFAPLQDGEVVTQKAYEELSDEVKAAIEEKEEILQKELQKILRRMPQWQREEREKLKDLEREVAEFTVSSLLEELYEKYNELTSVCAYFTAVKEDILDNLKILLNKDEETILSLRRYRVNVLVDQTQLGGKPLVYEDHPNYANLFGRVDRIAQMGMLSTDFNLIRAGALHRANGGYLLLDARKLLTQPMAWEGLKRALTSRQIRIESMDQILSLTSTISLEPEPIPLSVKVVLFGSRTLYYLLSAYDEEFRELFKVAVDFSDTMERDEENHMLYASLLATLIRKEKLQAFDQGAVARVIEHSARIAGDSQKLSAQMGGLMDVLREAHYWSKRAGRSVTCREDVQKAIETHKRRHSRIQENMQEQTLRGTIFIDTDGSRVGQINGLSVLQLGSVSFGRPTRITVSVRMGKGKVVDIEREVDLGGPLHSKGVLILTSFLSARYATHHPLTISASIVFEQSYSGVDGDSASSTELYALLSAISGLAIRQDLAVTGSVNQYGEVQPIGGVNEKIEGFFDLCQARGLTGKQGVLIPAANVKHLMLREDVCLAVERGQFSIYPIESIDQGIELLTGVEAGEISEDGHYPEGSVNHLVQQKLSEYNERWMALQKAYKGKEQDTSESPE